MAKAVLSRKKKGDFVEIIVATQDGLVSRLRETLPESFFATTEFREYSTKSIIAFLN